MDFPFVANPWSSASASYRPRYDQTLRPGGIPIHHLHPEITPPPQPVKPKVVSIPVHFLGSERRRPDSDSAVTIQKAFRGYLVRKNMNKIKAINEEVNNIKLTVSKKETVDSIRIDSKERLKVNETLMSLLIKLDSIKGVDSGVRDVRKAVIKKVVALQEQVDAIVAEAEAEAEVEVEVVEQNQEGEGEESETDSSANPDENDNNDTIVEEVEENGKEEKGRSEEGRKGKEEEVVERMMEENEKMMRMMAELMERNEMQTRLLSALSQRVEQLEKAFLFDKLRRQKKKRSGSVDCAADKCGKR